IAAAFGEDFKDVALGMITPDTGIHPLAFAVGGARLANVRWTEDAVTTIKPAVGAPRKGVQSFVRVGFVIPTIKQDARITGGLRVVPIFNRHKHQVRRGADPDATVTDSKAADEIYVFKKDRAFIGFVVAIRVF